MFGGGGDSSVARPRTFIDFGPFVAVFIAFMAVLGAIAEQVGICANANVLLPVSYTTSSLNPYGAKMSMDAAQHIISWSAMPRAGQARPDPDLILQACMDTVKQCPNSNA